MATAVAHRKDQANQSPMVRNRLVEALTVGLRSRHCLMYGGPGFGKTTLLSQLATRYTGTIYWYDLQKPGTTPGHILDLLGTIAGDSASAPEPRTSDPTIAVKAYDDEARLCQLTQCLTQAEHASKVLVLDHLHAAPAVREFEDLLGRLISQLPTGIRIVVVARELPTFPWARLELAEGLFRVGPDELRFTLEEVSTLADGFGLDSQVAFDLRDICDGWPLGLMHGLRLLSAWSSTLTYNLPLMMVEDILLQKYFMEEILEVQTASTKSFLLQTSVLPFFSEHDVDELLGYHREAVDVARIKNITGLVRPSAHHPLSYEYNQLLRAFLNRTANRLLPRKQLEELSMRAASICEQHGMADEARRNYMVAGAFQPAADLLERVAEDYLEAYMLEAVSAWSNELPVGVRLKRPWVLAYQGKALRRLGKVQAGMPLLESALGLFEKQDNQYGIAFTSYELSLALNSLGRLNDAIRVSLRALQLVGDDHALQSRLYIPMCMNYAARDDYDAAIQAGSDSLRALEHIPTSPVRPMLESRTRQYMARAYARRGQGDAARLEAERSLELCDEYDLGTYKRVWCLHSLALALTVAGERKHALEVLDLADGCGQSDNPAQERELNLIRGYLYLEEQDPTRAERYLLPCEKHALHLLAYAKLMEGDIGVARTTARLAIRHFGARESAVDHASALIVGGIVDGAANDHSAAIAKLESAIGILERQGALQSMASAWLRLSLVNHAMQDQVGAKHALYMAVSIARAHRIQHFLWAGVQALMRAVEIASINSTEQAYCMQALRLDASQGSPASVRALSSWDHPLAYKAIEAIPGHCRSGSIHAEAFLARCGDPDLRNRLKQSMLSGELDPTSLIRLRTYAELTWREIEVYCQYVLVRQTTGCTTKNANRSKIAESLNMSENTLKVHAMNVRRKLRNAGIT